MLIYEKIIDGIFLTYSDSQFWFKCNGILIKNKDLGDILIDCNCFYEKEIIELTKNQIEAYFVSHVHLDHVYNLHFYEELNPAIKIYCPIPENEYLTDFNNFVRDNGTLDYGIKDNFKEFAFEELGFRELKTVTGFQSGNKFKFNEMSLRTVPIPGHSPAQTAFLIEKLNGKSRKVLFVADIGLTKMGPWYGFKYCDLNTFRSSIISIANLYRNDDYIITSGHGPIIFEKDSDLFENLLKKLDENEEKILTMLNYNHPKSLDELIFKGLFFSEKYIEPMKGDRKNILYFFENNMILSHLIELAEKGEVLQVGENKWILNN
jgi:glyoxylase-like metal-dependent hydrolase (beta-lactamase superfamily II)